jgi:hypothetical protein
VKGNSNQAQNSDEEQQCDKKRHDVEEQQCEECDVKGAIKQEGQQ